MAIIALFKGAYCLGSGFDRRLAQRSGYSCLTEADVIKRTSERFNVPAAKLIKALYHKPSVFNNFTQEKQRLLTYIQVVLSETLPDDKAIYEGFSAHLIPVNIYHVLRVCAISDILNRKLEAARAEKLSEHDAAIKIQAHDNELFSLTQFLFKKSPWEKTLYDILLPTDKVSEEEALSIIMENAEKITMENDAEQSRDMADFKLASKVRLRLVENGHDVIVTSKGGEITITVNKHTLRLKKLEAELTHIAVTVDGVKLVSVVPGPDFNDEIYRKYDIELPSKVLVVDDEKDFALTLSNRLQLRDIGTAAVFSGEEALGFVDEETPEVLVLDLKMDGISGLDVLKEIKRKTPRVEVIILTGQGTDADRDAAMSLGAYAYFEKPFDINKLLTTIKDAHKKARR
ncbi:MAG: response regulator [Nitrospirae bacterium]|uniref:response regulator n=1 Tax=Candidatus Magnetominusculus dajiuhuensis TaxID=3137712 RepID=UPI0019F12E37|nr:response regulator [Nitrospirota bacterium]